jgi:hypothetical protein
MAIQTEGVDLRFAQVSALSYKIGWIGWLAIVKRLISCVTFVTSHSHSLQIKCYSQTAIFKTIAEM